MNRIPDNKLKNYILTNPFNFNTNHLDNLKENGKYSYYYENRMNPKEAILHVDYTQPSKEFINIEKKIHNYSILPHPDLIHDMIVFKHSKIKDYLKISIAKDTLITLSKLLSTHHSIHDLTGDYAMSSSFLTESLQSYEQYSKFYSIYLHRTRKGNKYDGHGCSSFKFINNPYNVDDIDTQVYAKKEKVLDYLDDVLRENITIQEYKDFYKLSKSKNEIKSKKEKVLLNIANSCSYNFNKTSGKNTIEPVPEEKYSSIVKFKLPKDYKDRIEQLESDIDYLKYDAQKTRFKTGVRLLKRNIVDEHLYFKRTFTESGRVFDMLNQLPKKIRKTLFREYVELDLANAAPRLIENKLRLTGIDTTKYKFLNAYIEKRDEIIKEHIKEVNNLRQKEYGKNIQIELKSIIKTAYLSLIFGRNIKSTHNIRYTLEKQVNRVLLESKLYRGLSEEVKEINELVKNKGYENLSVYFMLEETEIMNTIKSFLSSKGVKTEYIVSIHDGILIPKDEVKNLKLDDMKELYKFLKSQNQKIDLSEIRKLIRFNNKENERLERVQRRQSFIRFNKFKESIINRSMSIRVNYYTNFITISFLRTFQLLKYFITYYTSLELLFPFNVIDRFIYSKVTLQ